MDFYDRQCDDERTRERLADELDLARKCVRCDSREFPPIEFNPNVSEYLCAKCFDEVEAEFRTLDNDGLDWGKVDAALKRAKTFRFSSSEGCDGCGNLKRFCSCDDA